MVSTLEKERRLYQVLGVEEGATVDEVKRAYRVLAVRYHPDKNPDNEEAAEMFKQINHAHQLLSDPAKKEKYDRMGGSSEVQKFANNVYNRSSPFRDLEAAHRAREQELYRKRAARDPVRQGERRRASGSSMPPEQKEYWEKKDKERERELVNRLKTEKEQKRQSELERQRMADIARSRAEEGRRREAERVAATHAMHRVRERESERERVTNADRERKERLEAERQRQEEARKRELERQILRHQRQFEQAKEQKRREMEAQAALERERERAAFEDSEVMSRSLVRDCERKARCDLVNERITAELHQQHKRERANVEATEAMGRLGVTQQYHNAYRLLLVESAESQLRTAAEVEARDQRTSMEHLFICGRKYWEAAYLSRAESLAAACTVVRQIAGVEKGERALLEVVGAELSYRVSLHSSQECELFGLHAQFRIERALVHNRLQFIASEHEYRSYVEGEEQGAAHHLWHAHDVIQLLRREEADRNLVADTAMKEREEEVDKRLLAIRKRKAAEEQMRRDAEMQAKFTQLDRVESDMQSMQDQGAMLLHELQKVAVMVKRCQDDERVNILKGENSALRSEVAELRRLLSERRDATNGMDKLREENSQLKDEVNRLRSQLEGMECQMKIVGAPRTGSHRSASAQNITKTPHRSTPWKEGTPKGRPSAPRRRNSMTCNSRQSTDGLEKGRKSGSAILLSEFRHSTPSAKAQPAVDTPTLSRTLGLFPATPANRGTSDIISSPDSPSHAEHDWSVGRLEQVVSSLPSDAPAWVRRVATPRSGTTPRQAFQEEEEPNPVTPLGDVGSVAVTTDAY